MLGSELGLLSMKGRREKRVKKKERKEWLKFKLSGLIDNCKKNIKPYCANFHGVNVPAGADSKPPT